MATKVYFSEGSSKSRVSYESIYISQGVSGFATIVKDEKYSQTKNIRIEYLSHIIDGSQDFGWSTAKGAHAVPGENNTENCKY